MILAVRIFGLYLIPVFLLISLVCLVVGLYQIWQPRLAGPFARTLDPESDADEVGEGEAVVGRIIGIGLILISLFWLWFGGLGSVIG